MKKSLVLLFLLEYNKGTTRKEKPNGYKGVLNYELPVQ